MNTSANNCLGIITARGGSKGVPKKNVRKLGGRPTIQYAIDVAIGCPHIDTVVVTTDSEEIREVALKCGAEAPFLRPAELATDTAKQEDAILHAMDWYEERQGQYKYLCLLEPTSPLRRVETMNRAFELLDSKPEADGVFSVTECDFSPVFCSPLREDGYMKDWMDERYKWAQRQEIPAFYKLSALVTICKWNSFREQESFLTDRTIYMDVDGIEARDIDEPVEFFVVQSLIEQGFGHTADLAEYVRRDLE